MSESTQTLTFNFESPVHVAKIRVCATTYRNPDRRSNYGIEVQNINGEIVPVTRGLIDTTGDWFGTFHKHAVRVEDVFEIRFTLTREKNYGVCLKEIEIWSVD
jgi:hypothetical protein